MSIGICIPARDTVHTGFARSLSNLTARLTKQNIAFNVHWVLGSVICNSRTQLVVESLEANHTHTMWLDSDMHFPPSVVEDLLTHDKDIVAASYSTRYLPAKSVAFTDPNNIDRRLTAKTGLHDVWAVGMGCMLVKNSVYNLLPKPWFSHHYNPEYNDFSGEDIWFCNQANNHGIQVWVDADLSQKIGHFGTKAFVL